MTKEKLLNDIIEYVLDDAETPNESITEETLLIELGLDSFGLVMLLTEFDSEYECFTKEEFKDINYETYKVKDLIDKVLKDGNY